ncbi:MAG: Asp-tRNA(Asn)/Glu-tRNA(Gln) amidotransferase GatCAB subunit B [Candidatus Aquicultor secundus]|uniref:Aspartyl/glutamyl-tRNA(Asn/Gln) amidotransferase subunit B n=1 Tax=Candidatus Aquicultor secundus TaxID=1973895 RepID=A0A2M7T9B4_9ACTN|nr:Asp-tRNA(Asn)/Glu-tRNA(Gln) amidotransferase subunit GatB [Candidatus Aquicultor secundus]NCO65937.1 Asp-tRNA(Asn)/Glu-tRNA(Gln) amidotransferase subunit GatB [Solirubrobacter sp.]OIO86026.1 MAG: aspartyl/glutamyl-tRNA amidotransferase subunit B [Candidatus Aquicultor secundus]PIU26766.1 MAG: Asp-tRNA(Asn)/Glu-tRNA(Gln) amidotransferase GatCAB subunit B [Candidatus Aquicultor secundus]PIW22909.1 MAG: Asp-tRNA(Asn)/Glu-tRNA(Gln) amidotransferase GatCAB subunit B [Candidatus Aquicultor secundu
MEYESVIGLEIHVELDTESKMFCACSTRFGERPNTQTCPVCLGMPGSLPVANKKAIEYVIRSGLAVGCEISLYSQFHRKNYFYPDMPKDYQISQYDRPLCLAGSIDLDMETYETRLGITRIHLEEDTGKLIHIGGAGRIVGAEYSLVDFNRAGVPLMEIVSEPDMRTPEEAKAYARKLRAILISIGVSDCNMDKGSMRVDANISIRPKGATELGVKAELKNLNSFRSLQRALAYEIERQKKAIAEGEPIMQETRHWDETKGTTSTLRTKEYAHDYRYFPDPDLVPMEFDPTWIEGIRATLRELPDERKQRFITHYGLPAHDASLLTETKAMGDFFEETVTLYKGDPKAVSNWMLGDISYYLNTENLEIDETAVTPKHLAELLKLMDKGTISGKIAKEIFPEMFDTGKLPQIIVEEKGMTQISDESEIEKIIDMVLEENASAVREYHEGKERAFGFLVGQAMRLTKGRGNPQLINRLLREKLQG